MLDRYGRDVTELRVSVTPRCNLKCFFCHKEWDSSAEEASKDELLKTIEVARSFGVRRLKITGGEPLLRQDLPQIISAASSILEEVSVTTNGTLLSGMSGVLRHAGLARINVNLPTLTPDRYARICGANIMDRALEGIRAASSEGMPVKVNMVVLKGVNQDEIERMMDFTSSFNGILQLIELQPIPSDGTTFRAFHSDLASVENSISSRAVKSEAARGGQHLRYFIKHNGGNAVVEIVRPTNNPAFCRRCSKLRVTSDGRLKPCLLRSDNLVDIARLVRSGASSDELAACYEEAIARREPYWKD
ncbi:MAG TPA: GTP 3',8-cyclase MoaA [Thermoproteota archaeon]|nr:GTP 3',8-cyclase MoaA [Thermoproteota archaeon]